MVKAASSKPPLVRDDLCVWIQHERLRRSVIKMYQRVVLGRVPGTCDTANREQTSWNQTAVAKMPGLH